MELTTGESSQKLLHAGSLLWEFVAPIQLQLALSVQHCTNLNGNKGKKHCNLLQQTFRQMRFLWISSIQQYTCVHL